jgi:hypothetical protein
VADHRLRPGGLYDVLLTGVTVRLAAPDVPLLATEPVVLDHLWSIEPPRVFVLGSRLHSMGVVHLYARRGGSIDIGVRSYPSFDPMPALDWIERRLANPIHNLSEASRAHMARQLADQCSDAASQCALLYPCATASQLDLAAQMERCTRTLERNVEATRARELSRWSDQIARKAGMATTRRERRAAERKARSQQQQQPPIFGAYA